MPAEYRRAARTAPSGSTPTRIATKPRLRLSQAAGGPPGPVHMPPVAVCLSRRAPPRRPMSKRGRSIAAPNRLARADSQLRAPPARPTWSRSRNPHRPKLRREPGVRDCQGEGRSEPSRADVGSRAANQLGEVRKTRYLVLHDYGMGGLWWWVWAESAEEIVRVCAEVEVVTPGSRRTRGGMGIGGGPPRLTRPEPPVQFPCPAGCPARSAWFWRLGGTGPCAAGGEEQRRDRFQRVVFRVNQDVHRPQALRGHRRPADLQRRHHPDRHRVLPPRPYQGPGGASRGRLNGLSLREPPAL